MKKIKTTISNLNLGPFSYFLLTFLLQQLIFPVFSFSQAEEILTFTTYYPAPYGVYNELRSKKMAIGDTYYDGSQYCWAPASCTNTIYSNIDLLVEGTVSIGTNVLPLTNPRLYVIGPVEADAFRAFEASGVYAFIEAGPNDGNADMGGFSLATGDFASTRLDGDPLVLQTRSNGNVGIGTTGPVTRLDIWDTPWANGIFNVASSSGTSVLRITKAGNVGIGTEDPGLDKLDVRGRAYAEGGWQTTDADYAEWFEKEEDSSPGDLIGINLKTGKVRKYRAGDKFLGIHSLNPGIVGNRLKETNEEMNNTHTLVALLGQVDFDKNQVIIRGRIVQTADGQHIGILLNSDRVLLGR